MDIFIQNKFVSQVINESNTNANETLIDSDEMEELQMINQVEKLDDLFNQMKYDKAYEDML
jgi:hypothetical protein